LGWIQTSNLEADIRRLQSQSRELDKKVDEATETKKAVAEIQNWMATDVVWLDQILWLSKELPQAEDAMLTQLTLSVASGKKGEMTMDVRTRDVDAIDRLVTNLPDDAHALTTDTMAVSKSPGRYSQGIKASVLIDLGKKP
jgi:hypothetical protein